MFLSHCPTRAGILAVQVDESIRLSQRQFFENSIMPWLAVITGDIIDPNGKNMGKPQLDRFQITQIMQRLQHLHQGATKSGRAIILDRVVSDIKKISNTANEMDWMDSGTYNRDSIWRNFGTPRVVAGDIADANRATAIVADEVFLRNIVNPQINLLSTVMDKKLLPLYSKGRKTDNQVLWIEEATSSDTDGRREDMKFLASIGALINDEARAEFGMPPMPNGMGKVRVSSAMQIFEPIDDEAAAALEVREEYLPQDKPAATELEESTPEGQKPSTNTDRKPPEPKQLLLESKDYETAWLKLHGNNERPFAADMTKFLNAQVASICKKAETQRTVTADALFTPSQWDAPLKKIATPHLKRCAFAGAEAARERAKSFSKSDDPTIKLPPSVLQAILNGLDETLDKPYWSDINTTTLNRLKTSLAESIDKGDTTRERVERIHKDLGGRAAGARGLTIARTEATGMLNGGARAMIDELIEMGSAVPPEWLTTMDEHARPAHWDANGQKADAEGNFTVGGEKAKYPGDPNLSAEQRVNCILPGMLIEGEIDAAMRSFYDGESLEIVMASGSRLLVTPNHSILSENGFVAAGTLNKGQRLFSYRSQVEANAAPCVASAPECVNHEPAAIEKIFAAFSLSGDPEISRTAHIDFHGDEHFINGDVEIVWPARKLLRSLKSGGNQDGSDGCFVSEDPLHLPESRNGARRLDFVGINPANGRLPSSATLSNDSGSVLLEDAPLESLGFGLPAWSDSHVFQDAYNYLGGNSNGIRDLLYGPSRCELVANVRAIESFGTFGGMEGLRRFALTSDGDSSLSELQAELRRVNANVIGDLSNCPSSGIFLDGIVEIKSRHYRGPVYDIQSPHGIVVAQGICISNCRCSIV